MTACCENLSNINIVLIAVSADLRYVLTANARKRKPQDLIYLITPVL